MRLCERAAPAAQFHESYSSIVHSDDVIPELQSATMSGTRDASHQTAADTGCWGEAHALMRRPLRVFAASASETVTARGPY